MKTQKIKLVFGMPFPEFKILTNSQKIDLIINYNTSKNEELQQDTRESAEEAWL